MGEFADRIVSFGRRAAASDADLEYWTPKKTPPKKVAAARRLICIRALFTMSDFLLPLIQLFSRKKTAAAAAAAAAPFYLTLTAVGRSGTFCRK